MTQYLIKPRWGNTVDENFSLAVDQLRGQDVPSSLLAQFSFDLGFLHKDDPNSTYSVITSAAEDNGIAVEWED